MGRGGRPMSKVRAKERASVSYDVHVNADPGGRWLELDRDRWIFRFGKYTGTFLDDVAMEDRGLAYIRWILDEAEWRPTPTEEKAMREATGEIGAVGSKLQHQDAWVNVVVGRRSFGIPVALAEMFDQEMDRLQQIGLSDVAAFEAIVANSRDMPLESLV